MQLHGRINNQILEIEGLKAMGGFTKYSCHWLKKEKEESTDSKALVSEQLRPKKNQLLLKGLLLVMLDYVIVFFLFYSREKRLENKKLEDEEREKEKELLRREWEAKQRQERVELVKKLIVSTVSFVTRES